jgi:hypothetical protein
MNQDRKPNPVLAGLAVLFTIATLMIAGCTGSPGSDQTRAITTPETQAGHATPPITTTRTIPVQVSQPSTTTVPADTSDPSERGIPSGILINGIRDITAGDPLVVSGRTSLPVGTELIVIVVPTTMESGKITGNFKNRELSAVTKVTAGAENGNRFSVTLDTGKLEPAEHILFVSDKNDESADSTSEPVGVTGSTLFNIIGR